MKSISKITIRPTTVFFFLSVAAIGLFHEYLAAFAGVVLSCLLLLSCRKEKKLSIKLGPAFLFVAVTVLFYGIGALFAVDPGMAIIGFFKFLPVLLFTLCISKGDGEEILRLLPYGASLITLLSAAMLPIPVIGEELLVAGRFAGPFQYPNAFAMFLLLGELELLSRKKTGVPEILCHVILLVGIFTTGSRTVFVLTLLSVSVFLLFMKGKRIRVIFLIAAAASVLALVIYSALFDSFGIFRRVLSLSFTESTFVGRFLYYMDALPQILRRPFGMGYMGYYYTQSAFQTGVYSVTYVHNDFLQILLDVGWVPFGLMVFAFIKSLSSKQNSVEKKIILITFALHLLFDFDLQFLPMFFLLVLYLLTGEEKNAELRTRQLLPYFSAAALCSLYVCIALALSRFGLIHAAQTLYPWNTANEMKLLSETEDVEAAAEIADHILARNDDLLLAHCAKARQDYAKGDFASLVERKNEILEIAPFQYQEYEEYAYMLITGIGLYERAGDSYSVEICKNELLALDEKLEVLPERLSRLGTMIKDQPENTLPDEISVYINNLKNMK
ncbi:MAG: O-antigen ligase family protein [Clostridia bacterium]|nr:O-antigen ligase family protein [Clostridia bacterium]